MQTTLLYIYFTYIFYSVCKWTNIFKNLQIFQVNLQPTTTSGFISDSLKKSPSLFHACSSADFCSCAVSFNVNVWLSLHFATQGPFLFSYCNSNLEADGWFCVCVYVCLCVCRVLGWSEVTYFSDTLSTSFINKQCVCLSVHT